MSLSILLLIATTALVVAVGILIFGVLIPGKRYTFGDNPVTADNPTLTTAGEVYEVQWREYRFILKRLTDRNTSKARALHKAYLFYGLVVLAGAVAVGTTIFGDI